MDKIEVIKQTMMWGETHYRVCNADNNGLVFGRIMTDFPSRDEAVKAIEADYRRNKKTVEIINR